MRWTLNCILLASIAVISATEDDARNKRDLTYIKNLITGKIFGVNDGPPIVDKPKVLIRPPGNYRLFRVPGFEKILVKATPKKVTGVETVPSNNIMSISQASAVVEQNPNIAIINSYLGTNQLNETLIALQKVKSMLESGVLEAHREGPDTIEGSYPSVLSIVESGKVDVNEYQRPFSSGIAIPVPMIEGYRPVEIMRLPDLPLPTKYSYKQASHDGVTSYTAKDNKNVIVTHSNKPIPLPPFVTYRIQEVMSLGHRAPKVPLVPVTAIKTPPPPIYNVPKVPVFPTAVLPTVISPTVSFNGLPVPQVLVPPPPVKVETSNIPNSYSYNTVHHDGRVTSHLASGDVIDRTLHRPPVVITEVSKPAPLPVFLTNRLENVAATAMAAKLPHAVYDTPIVYRDHNPVIIEERPNYAYDHVSHWPPYGVHRYNKPLYREDVNIYLTKHKNNRPNVSQGPSEYSYKNVHADGSVTTYSDKGVSEEGKKEHETITPMVFPAKHPDVHYYGNPHHPHLVEEEICVDGDPVHFPTAPNNVHVAPPKANGYSYQSVHQDGSLTTYSGSGHVEQHNVAHPFPGPVVNALPPDTVPEIVNPHELFAGNAVGPQKVVFSQPVLSQYVYKQINHDNPDAFTNVNLGALPANGQVNVHVGEVPVPKPYLSPPPPPVAVSVDPRFPVFPIITPELPPQVFVTPPNAGVSASTRNPIIDGDKSGQENTHAANEGIQNNTDAAVNSATSPPIVNIEKTSSSVSVTKSQSPTRPKFIKTVRRRKIKTTTAPTSVEPTTTESQSLSDNPIVVMPAEQTFSFKQDRADGSSITVVGNNESVSVVEENKTEESHRGDIPNASF